MCLSDIAKLHHFFGIQAPACPQMFFLFALCETNLKPSISNDDLMVSWYLPLSRKDSCIHMHGLGVYVREDLLIARIPTLEIPEESFMCFRLSLLHSTSYLFFLYRSPSSQSCSVIDSVSRSIDNALLLHPNADILCFGDLTMPIIVNGWNIQKI